tara:strand:- start:27 stop:479 length:453 start_codon:yes stop_codon:yes gene_type:complete
MARRAREVDNLKIIEKIPIFSGLSLSQVKRLLDAGETRRFETGRTLCREAEKSTDLFILMGGEVAVQVGQNEMARVTPVEVIGEMGVITTQPRSATVEVVRTATAIVISKIHFDQILKSDHELAAKLYKNVIEAMGKRLRNANEMTSSLI